MTLWELICAHPWAFVMLVTFGAPVVDTIVRAALKDLFGPTIATLKKTFKGGDK